MPLLCAAIVLLPEQRIATATPDAARISSERRGIREVLANMRPTATFTWAWIIRLLVNLVNALVLVYLYYFLADGVGLDGGTDPLMFTENEFVARPAPPCQSSNPASMSIR